VAEYVDNDISAAGAKHRPGFEKLLEDITDGRVDTVVAWAWDRLERNRRDALRLIEAGQKAKLTVALVRGSDIDMSSAAGRMVADILASVARAEIDAKAERQQRAGLQRAQSGRPPARRAFGYQQDGTPHPVEAPVVAELFSLFLAGATIVSLSSWLKQNGHLSTRGRPWEDTGVRAMLINPRYAGERHYRGERVSTGTWQPIVSPETFAAVQAILTDPARKKSRPSRRHLGSSLFRCWCGSLTKSSYANGGNRVYVCQARRHMQRNADPVDEVVRAVIVERLRRRDLTDLFHQADVEAAKALRERAVGLRSRLDALASDYAEGNLTGRQVKLASDRIRSTLGDVEAQLADLMRGSATAAISGATDPGEAWLSLPLDRQRAVIADLATIVLLKGRVGRGAFDPETVQIEWRAC
jgi:site-specific DNA recombinase